MTNRRSGVRRSICVTSALAALMLLGEAAPCRAITPDDPGPAAIQFSIDSAQDVKSISPYIYGSNSSAIANRTLDRAGGNRWTGYNWETNASNAGADYYHHSDYFLTGGQAGLPPGAAVSGMIEGAAANGRAALVTVPMAGYVSADANGTVDETEIAPSPRWHEVVAQKSTIYPGSELSLNPNKNDDYVFTDEFVHWAENFKQPNQPLFYSLDNEPALWGEELPPGWQSGIEGALNPSSGGRTHPTIHPYAPTYQEMRDKTIAHASAIKDVNPDALVFGGVGYGWFEAINLQSADDRTTSPSHPGGDQPGELHYYEWLLNEVAAEEAAQGRTLMDVIDLHWYPEARGGGRRIVFEGPDTPAVIAARVQAPRSLWDETYVEESVITDCCNGGNPIMLLRHLQRDVVDFKPGTKIAITEYNYGGGDHYSGGIAEADFLGILGREGVFAANWWDLGNGSSFVDAAFDMYRDFDGQGGAFGDTSIAAESDDIAQSAVYASLDSSDSNRMTLVAINRTAEPLTTGIAVAHDQVFDYAEVYQLTGSTAAPVRVADIPLALINAFEYTMPAFSVSTLVLVSDHLAGDYNDDGVVNAADYAVWRNTQGQTVPRGSGADGDYDGTVTQSDYDVWTANFGNTAGQGGAANVPEPASFALLAGIGLAIAAVGRSNSSSRRRK